MEESKVINTSTFKDITGQQFNELTALRYLGDRKWEWQCSCGKICTARKNDVTSGKKKSCGHLCGRNQESKIKVGDKFNEWKVIEVISARKIKCECSCGNKISIINKYDLENGKTKSCGHLTKGNGENGKIDITGQQFGEWKVISYDETNSKYGYWKCQCSCGKIKSVKGLLLRKGESKSCGHNTNAFQDLTGKTFGEWKVIRFKGDYKWECKCSCGNIRDVSAYDLKTNKSTNCGHKRLTDLSNQRFGKITVGKYLGNNYWECKCDCGNSTTALTNNLLNGNKKSCGCLSQDKKQEIIDKIEVAISIFITKTGNLPFIEDIAELTELTTVTVNKYVKELNLSDYINKSFGSKPERELYELSTEYVGKIDIHNRGILGGKELDIYIPDKKLAIEFNGTYWHSTEQIADKHYHQNKTIECVKKGIRLIHIFEYEWSNYEKRERVEKYLRSLLKNNKETIYARNTEIKMISNPEADKFLNTYHLQGTAAASIHLGCFYDNELIGVMTFGVPRFNNSYEYEIVRFCWKNTLRVIGGAEKIFKHFLQTYKPQSVITYSDISKFTGNVYSKMGFKPIQPNPVTEPNYVWVDSNGSAILTRYQTMKHKLIEKGLGTEDQTEDEIMIDNGFLKIYDAGNIKLEWKSTGE